MEQPDNTLGQILSAPIQEGTPVYGNTGMDPKIQEILNKKKEEMGLTDPEPKQDQKQGSELQTEPDQSQTVDGQDLKQEIQDDIVKLTPGYTISDFIKANIKEGKWEDLELEEDGKVFKVSEMGNFTEEQVWTIYNEQAKIQEEKLKESYIPVDGLDEYQKAVIELVKVGGKDAARGIQENPELLEVPFKDVDLEDVNGRAFIYIEDLMSKGVSESDAIALAKSKEGNGELYGISFAIRNTYHKNYLEQVDQVKQRYIEEQEAQKEKEKNYKKELKATYIENGYDPVVAERLTNAATEKTEEEFNIDSKYYEIMSDPKKAYRLVEYLMEPESFEKRIQVKTANAVNMETFTNLRRVQTTKPVSGKGKISTTNTSTPQVVFAF